MQNNNKKLIVIIFLLIVSFAAQKIGYIIQAHSTDN